MNEEPKQEEMNEPVGEPGQELKEGAEQELGTEKSAAETKDTFKTEEPKDKTSLKVEIPKNCGACKKPIQKIRYYKNMQFFCNKQCWKKFKKTEDEKKQKEAEPVQEPAA
ncbi:MAG: hypothetical protein ABIG64_10100 [Candidatus Omnitrophota bacterium]